MVGAAVYAVQFDYEGVRMSTLYPSLPGPTYKCTALEKKPQGYCYTCKNVVGAKHVTGGMCRMCKRQMDRQGIGAKGE